MEPTPLAEVIGANVQRLRTQRGVTTGELAKAARGWGLKWTDSRVSAMERGKVAATFATMVALTQAMESILGEPVPLSRLIEFDGFVQVNEDLSIRGNALARFVSSAPITLDFDDVLGGREMRDEFFAGMADPDSWSWTQYAEPGTTNRLLRPISKAYGETEARVARDLGIDQMRLVVESANLWQRSFTQERDARAGENANAQKRGRVARELKAELRARVDRGDDQ